MQLQGVVVEAGVGVLSDLVGWPFPQEAVACFLPEVPVGSAVPTAAVAGVVGLGALGMAAGRPALGAPRVVKACCLRPFCQYQRFLITLHPTRSLRFTSLGGLLIKAEGWS